MREFPKNGVYVTPNGKVLLLSKRDGPYQVFNTKTRKLGIGEVAVFTVQDETGVYPRVRINRHFNCEYLGEL